MFSNVSVLLTMYGSPTSLTKLDSISLLSHTGGCVMGVHDGLNLLFPGD